MVIMAAAGASVVCRETARWIEGGEIMHFDFLFFMFSSSMAALLRDWLGKSGS